MKIKLTESQYKKLILENERFDRLVDLFIDDVRGKDLIGWISTFLEQYNFNVSDIKRNDKLYNLFRNKLYNLKKRGGYSARDFGKYYIQIQGLFDYVMEKETKAILDVVKNPELKLKMLMDLEDIFPWVYEKDLLLEVIDGLLYDSIKHMFDNYPPKEAVKKASILKSRLGGYRVKNMIPIVKDFAEKNGLTIIPKHKGYTFERGEETMIRDLIKYMKDIPELPKKTKRGFLNYIGSRRQGPGQYSTFWSGVNRAGIIQKIGGGNNVTYELGPNYKAWEEGNTVAF